MNEDRAKWTYIEMSRKGFLKKEPNPMQREGSSVWIQVIQTLWQERRSVTDLASELSLAADEVESLIFVNREERKSEPPPRRGTGRPGFRLVG